MLSIIIVNYFSTDLIAACIESIIKFNNGLAFEIIVVDNSSDVKGKEKILQQFPDVQWIDMGYNSGFSRANNAGMKIANGDTYLLLNPDTLCLDDSISICYQRINESAFAAGGVQLLDAVNKPQISGSHFVKGGLNHLLPIPYWGAFIRWIGYKAKTKVPGVQQPKAVEKVDWISGAFLMVKKSVVEKVGLMDEDFFLYAEEVEWCSRLQKAGELCIYGDLKIVHLEGATINKSQNIQEKGYFNLYDKKGLQLMVSNHVRVRKQYGLSWFFILLLNYTFGVIVFFVASTIDQIIHFKNPFAYWKKVGQFAKNVAILWSLAPTIISNKTHFYKMF